MNDVLMQVTIRDYVCSKCWGHLVAHADPKTRWQVECPKCGPGEGFVTKYYADQRREASLGESREVGSMLQGLGVTENPHKGKSEKQLIKELGY